MTDSPMDLYRAGRIDEAVAGALEMVKKSPADTVSRFQLAELSCIAGDLERADRQLDTVSNQDPQAAVGAALFRQLVRAELARRECFEQNRAPEFLGEPSATVQTHLRALIAIIAGDLPDAAAQLRQSTATLQTPSSGPITTYRINDETVTQIRDLDDVLAPVLEVHTSTGKYFWVAWEQIDTLVVHEPKRPIDLLWRQASLSVHDGPDGEVYLPAIYPPMPGSTDDAQLRLGRGTDWASIGEDIVRGRGQKMLLAGERELSWMELRSIETVQ